MKVDEKTNKDTVYLKSAILTSKRYVGKTDLLKALLKDDESYSLKKVDDIIEKFMKGGR